MIISFFFCIGKLKQLFSSTDEVNKSIFPPKVKTPAFYSFLKFDQKKKGDLEKMLVDLILTLKVFLTFFFYFT